MSTKKENTSEVLLAKLAPFASSQLRDRAIENLEGTLQLHPTKAAFVLVYGFDGYDSLTQTFNGVDKLSNKELEDEIERLQKKAVNDSTEYRQNQTQAKKDLNESIKKLQQQEKHDTSQKIKDKKHEGAQPGESLEEAITSQKIKDKKHQGAQPEESLEEAITSIREKAKADLDRQIEQCKEKAKAKIEEEELDFLDAPEVQRINTSFKNITQRLRVANSMFGTLCWSPLAMVVSFFGLSTRIRTVNLPKSDDFTLLDVVKNFLGWPTANFPIALKYWTIPFITVFNLIAAVSKTLWNTLTLITEFAPRALEEWFLYGISKLINNYNKADSGGLGALGLVGVLICIPFYYACKLWRLVGATITSPVDSIRYAWAFGEQLGGPFGKLLGASLALLSAALTISFYTIFFPLVFKALPTAITNFISGWGNSIINAIGNFVMNVPTTFGNIVSLSSSLMSEAAAFSALIVTTLACFYKPIASKLGFLYHPEVHEAREKQSQEHGSAAEKSPLTATSGNLSSSRNNSSSLLSFGEEPESDDERTAAKVKPDTGFGDEEGPSYAWGNKNKNQVERKPDTGYENADSGRDTYRRGARQTFFSPAGPTTSKLPVGLKKTHMGNPVEPESPIPARRYGSRQLPISFSRDT